MADDDKKTYRCQNMAMRKLLLLSMLVSTNVLADVSMFYEENQSGLYSWGVRTNSDNMCDSDICGMYMGLSLDSVSVYEQAYVTANGHFRLAFTPNSSLSPYVNVGLDLLETGVFLFSDGEITPKIDVQYGYGLRINLPEDNAISVYHKTSKLSGYTILDGTYSSYGIEFITSTPW